MKALLVVLFCFILFSSFVAASVPGIPGLTLREPLPMDCSLQQRNFSREQPTVPLSTGTSTAIEFSRSYREIYANDFTSISFMATGEKPMTIFISDVDQVGVVFDTSMDYFRNVLSKRSKNLAIEVPESSFKEPFQTYTLKFGAIPSDEVEAIKNKYGGAVPPVEEWTILGEDFNEYGTADFKFKVIGINYPPIINIRVDGNGNTDGSATNPLQPGSIDLIVDIYDSDPPNVGQGYGKKWTVSKLSGSYCTIPHQLHYNGAENAAHLTVFPVSTTVRLKVDAYVEDGAMTVHKDRIIYIAPLPDGCGS